MKNILRIFIISLTIIGLTACASSAAPVDTIENYLNALAAKDGNSLSVLSCGDYAESSQQLLDSFTAVDIRLADLVCSEVSNDGQNAVVNCTGTIVATYNGEDQNLDLSSSNFLLKKQNGDWLVCGQE